MIRVKVVYRNYKPLHDLYASFTIRPPEGVCYVIPKPIKFLRLLYPIYLRFGDHRLLKRVIRLAQGWVFQRRSEKDAQVLHFAQVIPDRPCTKPYVVDFEHIVSLASFVEFDATTERLILERLCDPNCRAIMPLSYAAQRSLRQVLGGAAHELLPKTEVVYPALPNYYAMLGDQPDYTHVSPDPDALKLLFVGNSVYKKGLQDLLCAYKIVAAKWRDIKLYVVSDVPACLRRQYPLPGIRYFRPRFVTRDIVRMFYLPCDVLVMPTHDDTFGMTILHALSCATPVVTTEQFAAPELIEPGKNGLFVHSDRLHLEQVSSPNRETTKKYHRRQRAEQVLVDDLVSKIGFLYLNRDAVRDMGRRAVDDFAPGGKFSVEVRNRSLARAYLHSLADSRQPLSSPKGA